MIDEAEETLRRFVEALERAGVPYMLTGSFASAYYGRARGTQDIDLVIAPTREQLHSLLAQLNPPGYYVDSDAAFEALREHAQFNAIDRETAYKADFIIRKPRRFSEEEFSRRVHAVVAGVPVAIATAEDVILAKLEWAKLGSSLRQIEDAAGILEIRSGGLDRAYIESWVERLGLHEQWTAALRTARLLPE